MISQLAFRNCQSLQNVTLELGRITIIVGHSDAGKSALVRALERACFNDSAYEFLTIVDGVMADKAMVGIKTEGGMIVWERTKSSVKYTLATQTGRVEFTKMGRSTVPPEILAVLGVRELQIDTGTGPLAFQRIQFSKQFDTPFLVGDRGGVAAARVLGHLTGVHVFANANKRAYSASAAASDGLKQRLSRQQKLKNELQTLEGVEQRYAALTALRDRLKDLRVRESRLANLVRLNKLYQSQLLAEQRIQYRPEVLQHIDGLKPPFIQLWKRLSQLDKLYSYQTQWRSVAVVPPAPAMINLPDLTAQRDKLERLRSLQAIKSKYTLIDQRLSGSVQLIDLASKDRIRADEALNKFSKDFPLCPFVDQFDKQQGNYRCQDVMVSIRKRQS
jgi:hypothetical protein